MSWLFPIWVLHAYFWKNYQSWLIFHLLVLKILLSVNYRHRKDTETWFCVSVPQCSQNWCHVSIRLCRDTRMFFQGTETVKSHRLGRGTCFLPVDWPSLFTAQWNHISVFCPWQCSAVLSLLQFGGKWWSSKTNVCQVLLRASLKHKMWCTLPPLLWFSFQTHSFIPIPGQSPMAVGTLMRVFILKGFVPKTCIAEPAEFRVIGPMNHYTAAELPPLHHEFTVWTSSALCLHDLHYLQSLCFHFYFFPW